MDEPQKQDGVLGASQRMMYFMWYSSEKVRNLWLKHTNFCDKIANSTTEELARHSGPWLPLRNEVLTVKKH